MRWWPTTLKSSLRSHPNQEEQFAIADGFSSFDELADFFKDRMPFEGVLIAWGDWQPYWTSV
ncbi:hypothetical protein SPB21_22585 [Leptothoe sp. ISB3NOV94-8A]